MACDNTNELKEISIKLGICGSSPEVVLAVAQPLEQRLLLPATYDSLLTFLRQQPGTAELN
jgi:hypothetical protein